MFLAGQGRPLRRGARLTQLDVGDNLLQTTDFWRVYATAMKGGMRYDDTNKVLRGEFETFPVFD